MAGMLNMARGGSRRQSQGFAEINVTPLVDVMLVLLVVFMISAPMLTVGVPLDLPKTKAAQLNDQIDPVVISVDAEGRSFLQETELSGDVLIERLKIVTQSNPEAKIYVRGDAKLAYGRIMEVMGEISASGFTKVSLLAEMPAGPKTQPVVGPKAKGAAVKTTTDVPVQAVNNTQKLPTLHTLMQSSQSNGAKAAPAAQAPAAVAPVRSAPAPARSASPAKATPTVVHPSTRAQAQTGQPQVVRGFNTPRTQGTAPAANRASGNRPAQG